MSYKAIFEAVDSFFNDAKEFRKDLHMHPELSFKEFETTKKIVSKLESFDLSPKTFPETTGVFVDICSNNKEAKTVLLRADIDALPIQDEKDVSYRSRNSGVMHACGHDVHTTVLLTALKALSSSNLSLPFNVKGVFQPAEELGEGARSLINQGVLENVNYAISLHVDPTIPVGSLAVKPGPINAGITSFAITFIGSSAHGARPHLGVDAIQIAAQFISTAYAKVPRSVDARDSMVLHFGTINGGRAMNFVADSCTITGALRTFKNETMKEAVDELRKVAESTAVMFGGSVDFTVKTQMPAVINENLISDSIYYAAEKIIGKNQVITDLPSSMGGEDFGAFLQHVPGGMFRLGIANIKENTHMLHTPLFDAEEESISIGAKTLALSVFELAERTS